ncbi:MAG: hypothetical protein KKH21_07740 [Gammaproteobacteria bacterium]|nr:hypothetical protein [Gammaproteobacteria bacterium]
MTPDKTPSDSELKAFAIAEQFMLFCDEDEFIDIARAVLAKWGSPVVAEEPHDPGPWQVDHWKARDEIVLQSHHFEHDVALVVNGDFANLDQKKAYAARLCAWINAATLQPTQAQAGAVPLTRDQVKAILVESGYDGAAAQHRADFINGLRHGEAAHGITHKEGGHHGLSKSP